MIKMIRDLTMSDLVMNFFVAYENPVTGELITDHRKIANRYLKGWFIIDLLATFPSDYIVKAVQVAGRHI